MADDEQRLYYPESAWLSQEQLTRAGRWLADKWSGAGCPFHGDTTWSVGPFLAGIPAHTPPQKRALQKVYPSLTVICTQCGYTVLVNSNLIGLSESDAPVSEESTTDEPEKAVGVEGS